MERLTPEEKSRVEQYRQESDTTIDNSLREQVLRRLSSLYDTTTPPVETKIPPTSGERKASASNSKKSILLEFGKRVQNGESLEQLVEIYSKILNILASEQVEKEGESLTELLEKTLINRKEQDEAESEVEQETRQQILNSISIPQNQLDEKVKDIMKGIFS